MSRLISTSALITTCRYVAPIEFAVPGGHQFAWSAVTSLTVSSNQLHAFTDWRRRTSTSVGGSAMTLRDRSSPEVAVTHNARSDVRSLPPQEARWLLTRPAGMRVRSLR